MAGMGPRRELRSGAQVDAWLRDAASRAAPGATLTLVGFGALLWHAFRLNPDHPSPHQMSMHIDPVTDDERIAEFGYDCVIGSAFELEHGFHINLMPKSVLRELPVEWEQRAIRETYENLMVIVPSPRDLLVPKVKRGEPRDRMHVQWAEAAGLIDADTAIELLAVDPSKS
jgi:hypothetical protein